ncbi:MAG TPA: tetratricopeptide repeat protein [Synechococcales cyanobacterium M55_K2018_004]|nr:tetratricopeptide repeat protein [Synechococcales cyanobacterium M55_K2018_004]
MEHFQATTAELRATSIDFSTGGELLLLPSLSALLGEPVQAVSPWEFAHRLAADNWQHHYQPRLAASPLDRVRGLLEAFHHRCEVADWPAATQILRMSRPDWQHRPLHQQLGYWGYYAEQVDLYAQLVVGEIPPDLQCLCLNGLGSACCYLGQFQQAIAHYHHQLTLARRFRLVEYEAQALGGMGRATSYLGHFKDSYGLFRQQLQAARQVNCLDQMGWAWAGLGVSSVELQKYRQGVQYLQQALAIAQQMTHQELYEHALTMIGSAYMMMGKPRQAIRYFSHQQQTDPELHSLYQQWLTRYYLGVYHVLLGEYDQGEAYFQEILQNRSALNPYQLSRTVGNLGALYARQGKHQRALECGWEHFYLEDSIGRLDGKFSALLNLSYSYLELGQFPAAKDCITQAGALLRHTTHPQDQGLYLAACAAYDWKQKRYGRSLVYLAKAWYLAPPWKSEDGKIITKIAVQEISRTIWRYLSQIFLSLQRFLSGVFSLKR